MPLQQLRHLLLLAIALVPFSSTLGQELKKSASWDWPTASSYNEQVLSYLDQKQTPEAQRTSVEEVWQNLNPKQFGPEVLDGLLRTASLIDERIAAYVSELTNPNVKPAHPQDLEWLTSDVPGWMQDTLRLACGRAYAQRELYDESLELLVGLDPTQVCDPSTLIFYQAVAEHHLLKQEECVANLELLLERQEEVPTRYAQLAKMMMADMQGLETDSLDEVARLMRDVERRLELGRAGKRVRDEEQEITDKLQKMIEDIEEQLQQQQQQQQDQQDQQQQQQQQSQSNPLQESQRAGERGDGDVKQKSAGDRAGWGNLPPAQRQEALQRLTEDMPSHYRDVIEGYFRQLSQDK